MLSVGATVTPPVQLVDGDLEPERVLVAKNRPRPCRTSITQSDIVYETQKQQVTIASLVQEFTILPITLKTIKDRFKSEMAKGLAKQGETLAMVQTHILGRLNGSETGTYLTLDIGGTYLRVVLVELSQGSAVSIRQEKYAINPLVKVGEPKVLFDFMATCIDSFLLANDAVIPKWSQLELGFTFSFPVLQTSINSGTLIEWTKGYTCHGMVGKDPAKFLQQALLSRNLNVNVSALMNDTVGTLLSHAYQHPHTVVGLGLGTGSNAAYIERVDRIGKRDTTVLGDNAEASEQEMAINIEFGAFDNERTVLPMTMFDNKVDRKSLNPSKQLFEKMIAGMYLGEITRNVLLDLIDNRLLFRGQSSHKLDTPWEFLTEYMSVIEEDSTTDLEDVRHMLEDNLGLGQVESLESQLVAVAGTTGPTSGGELLREPATTLSDRQIVKLVVKLIGERSARLTAAVLGGILEHTMGYTWARNEAERQGGVDIGVDGSLYGLYPGYESDLVRGLEELFVLEPEMSFLFAKDGDSGKFMEKIRFGRSLDGSSVGAALGASLATGTATDGVTKSRHARK
ncbi:glucokinase [Mortierella hygrophila]|uniref:Phosphotransferase n=1 Tax=Mortierella hygrophila TaxID=979708 RepID=A0A9P6K1R1_9FUNG|nr:glucokinase [Mortierella hygrophila]